MWKVVLNEYYAIEIILSIQAAAAAAAVSKQWRCVIQTKVSNKLYIIPFEIIILFQALSFSFLFSSLHFLFLHSSHSKRSYLLERQMCLLMLLIAVAVNQVFLYLHWRWGKPFLLLFSYLSIRSRQTKSNYLFHVCVSVRFQRSSLNALWKRSSQDSLVFQYDHSICEQTPPDWHHLISYLSTSPTVALRHYYYCCCSNNCSQQLLVLLFVKSRPIARRQCFLDWVFEMNPASMIEALFFDCFLG